MKYIILFTVLFAACSAPEAKKEVENASENATEVFVSEDTEYAKPNDDGTYGESFDASAQLCALDKIKAGSEACLVKGKVTEVCAKKGCWMSMNVEGEEIFVHFKDYGFFVPRDITEKDIILKGNSYLDTTSVDDLRHFAEDAGKSEEEIMAITEPKLELKFEATGAVVL